MELSTHGDQEHHITILFMCLCIVLYFDPMIDMLLIEVEPEQEAAPFVEDPEIEPRQQGKQNPIDHVDKIPLPSHVSLMHCIG